MDAVIFGFLAIVLTALTLYQSEESISVSDDLMTPEDVSRSTKLNDAFYEDPDAFTEISKALGFPKTR